MKDVFLSHASADKEEYVRPLARELEIAGVSSWLDEAEIAWGESIARKINQGLRDSKYVVVFVSRHFIGRRWPERELFAALFQEASEDDGRVLPVIIGNPAEVLKPYPLMAGLVYRRWEGSPRNLALNIARHVEQQRQSTGRQVAESIRNYLGFVTARDLRQAYACFSVEFRTMTPVADYAQIFAKTRKAELVECRLINTVGNVAFCHAEILAAGFDGSEETWAGSVEMVREQEAWFIRTMKGLRRMQPAAKPGGHLHQVV